MGFVVPWVLWLERSRVLQGVMLSPVSMVVSCVCPGFPRHLIDWFKVPKVSFYSVVVPVIEQCRLLLLFFVRMRSSTVLYVFVVLVGDVIRFFKLSMSNRSHKSRPSIAGFFGFIISQLKSPKISFEIVIAASKIKLSLNFLTKPVKPQNSWNQETHETTKPVKPRNPWNHETHETVKPRRNLWNHVTHETTKPMNETRKLVKPRNPWNHETPWNCETTEPMKPRTCETTNPKTWTKELYFVRANS